MTPGTRSALGTLLADNPFPHPLTLGFFYREKMRAIHRVAPPGPAEDILEVGGGQGGLTGLLYPGASITNLDMDSAFAAAPANQRPGMRFVCGDATRLPFDDATFDMVTMFDVLEHIPDDRRAAAEAWRVLRPGGWLLVSTPHTRWRYPWYNALRPIVPNESQLFAEWGHVRRGYTLSDLETLVGQPHAQWATFISPATALAHDLAFANLSVQVRRLLIMLIAPLTWVGYGLHRRHATGTETAVAWHKPGHA